MVWEIWELLYKIKMVHINAVLCEQNVLQILRNA